VFTKGLANEKKEKELSKIEVSALSISFFNSLPFISDRNENYTSDWKLIEV